MLAAALLCAWPAWADARASWSGTVSRVSDGDTLWVRPAAGGRPRKLRLHGIDAPEICQAHGQQARKALQRLVLRRQVEVQVLRVDDYRRPIARVLLDGQDLGARMVRDGHAWSYRYRHNPGPYLREEQQARGARRGLFAAPGPQQPYAFRRSHGPCTR